MVNSKTLILILILLPVVVWLLLAGAGKVLWLRWKLKLWAFCWRLRSHLPGLRRPLSARDLALRQAALTGNGHNTEILLRRGADPNLRLDYDWPLLVRVAERGYTDIARLLLAGGAYVDAANPSPRYTALICAAKNGHCDTVNLLLEHGADIEAETIVGTTALLAATIAGQTEVVSLLLRVMKERGIIPRQGLGALAIARERGFYEIVRQFKEAGIEEASTLLRASVSPSA